MRNCKENYNKELKVPEEWERVKLGEVFEIFDSQRVPLDSEYRSTIKGEIPYCGATGIIDFINDYLFEGEYVLIAEDGGKFNRFDETAYIMKGKFWANNHVHVVIGKIGILNNTFLKYFIDYEDIGYYISGSTREKLNQKLLRSIQILLPPLPEQQRIAEILETVDNAIEKIDHIIEKYKRIKQGLMQDLLTKGVVSDELGVMSDELGVMSDELGIMGDGWRLRDEKRDKFKDSPLGKIPEEWEVVRLGVVFNIYAGGDIDKLTFSDTKDEVFKYPIFSNTLENKGLYGYSNIYTYPENCITVTGRGTLGFAIPRFEKFNAIIRVLVLIPKIKTDIVFVAEYINSNINFTIESTGVPQLTAPKISDYKIPLPPLPEQQRIAEILSQIDEAIEKETAYKEKLQRLKSGLMEDLLTGKVRVNHLIKEK